MFVCVMNFGVGATSGKGWRNGVHNERATRSICYCESRSAIEARRGEFICMAPQQGNSERFICSQLRTLKQAILKKKPRWRVETCKKKIDRIHSPFICSIKNKIDPIS